MASVLACELPLRSLLRRYRAGSGYADCYAIDVPGSISQAAYVEAFYTTWLFKVERAILKWLAKRPSTDLDARKLSNGERSNFAAWRVEEQSSAQLLLADYSGRTRSWLMAVPGEGAQSQTTRLYFGSAVVPKGGGSPGSRTMGFGFHALLGFHRLYSRLLLGAASSRLLRKEMP